MTKESEVFVEGCKNWICNTSTFSATVIGQILMDVCSRPVHKVQHGWPRQPSGKTCAKSNRGKPLPNISPLEGRHQNTFSTKMALTLQLPKA
jgi:hypothetical protein